MKKSLRKYLFWFTMVMLAALLVLQVRWIMYSVRFQEKVFKNSVDLALDKTIANLNNDRLVCDAMRECMACDSIHSGTKLMSPGIWGQIHATIDAELAVYGIDLDYDVYITRHNRDTIRSPPLLLFLHYTVKDEGQYRLEAIIDVSFAPAPE